MNYITLPVIVILILTGAILALCASEIDILNPTTSQAEAERMQAETRHLETMNQLEEQRAAAQTDADVARIRHEMELEEARYQSELARIAADQAHYEKMLTARLNVYNGFMWVLIITAGLGGAALIIVGTRFALVRIEAHSPTLPTSHAKQPDGQPAHPRRHSPNGYEQMHIDARQRELLERSILLKRLNTVCSQRRITKTDYDKLPLAGD